MLEIKNLTAGYGEKNVLTDISFSLGSGECLSVIGPNGCGKTTLLKCIAKLIPFEGNITFSGTDLNVLSRRALAEKIAVMSQLSAVNFSYSVFDTVMHGRFWHIKPGFFGGKPQREDIDAVYESIEAVKLCDLCDRQINTLSGGQLQRVFLARVLAQNPQVILLDEPTNHLDLKHQVEIVDYIREWATADKSKKRAVIGVFHDMNIALRLSENALFIDDGKIGRIGKFSEVADGDYLKNLFGINVAKYMSQNAKVWENIL
jgi:iron complex transport system ATP-binding protein